MRVYAGILVLLCFVAAGCGKTHASKQVATVNAESLSVNEADTLLAQPADKTNPPAASSAPSVVANVITNTEVESKSEVALSSKEEIDPKMIQQALKNLGLYAGEVDGRIGHKTKEAVKEFQTRNNLTADGRVGLKTWVLLKKALEAPAPVTPQAGKTQK